MVDELNTCTNVDAPGALFKSELLNVIAVLVLSVQITYLKVKLRTCCYIYGSKVTQSD